MDAPTPRVACLKVFFQYRKDKDDVAFKHEMMDLGAFKVFILYGRGSICKGVAYVFFDSMEQLALFKSKLPSHYNFKNPTQVECESYRRKVLRQIPDSTIKRINITVPMVTQYFAIPFESNEFFLMNGKPHMMLDQLTYIPEQFRQEYIDAKLQNTPILVQECPTCLMLKPRGLKKLLWPNRSCFNQRKSCVACKNLRSISPYQTYLALSIAILKEFIDPTLDNHYLQVMLFQPALKPPEEVLNVLRTLKFNKNYLNCRLVCKVWFKVLPIVHAVLIDPDDTPGILEHDDVVEHWQISLHFFPQIQQRYQEKPTGK